MARIAWMAAVVAALAASLPVLAAPLDRFAWTARPIVVFALDANDPRLAQQERLFSGRGAEMQDRKTPLIVVGGATVRLDGTQSSLSANALRRRYGISPDAFTVLLIGKDEGVKLRRRAVTRPDEIFALIDRMPMRRQELRERGEKP